MNLKLRFRKDHHNNNNDRIIFELIVLEIVLKMSLLHPVVTHSSLLDLYDENLL